MKKHSVAIGDIHQKIDRLKIMLEHSDVESAEQVIFLGDYFDSFDDKHQLEATVDFLNQNVENDRFIFLMGNHDIHYLSRNKAFRCSGYSQETDTFIEKNLSKQFKKKVKLFEHQTIAGQSVLFSHAGLHPSFIPVSVDAANFDSLNDYLNSLDININLIHPLLMDGQDRSRSARQLHSGILWMDWYSLSPIEGLNQVVGHSNLVSPRFYSIENSKNVNIDTSLKYFLKINLDNNAWDVVKL
jgi:predicted phosphodiesterase